MGLFYISGSRFYSISVGESRLQEAEAAGQSHSQEQREIKYIHPYYLIAHSTLI